jgi:hypothetical protein
MGQKGLDRESTQAFPGAVRKEALDIVFGSAQVEDRSQETAICGTRKLNIFRGGRRR